MSRGTSGAAADDKRWAQIRAIRDRRQQLAAARAAQAAAEWRARQSAAQRQEAEVAQQLVARRHFGQAQRAQATGAPVSAADWREGDAWSGALQRRIDDSRRAALLAHAETALAQLSARSAQNDARRAHQLLERANQAIERAQARAAAAKERSEDALIEDLAPPRWWALQVGGA